MKWYGAERPFLFSSLLYQEIPDTSKYNSIAKVENTIAASIWKKLNQQKPVSLIMSDSTTEPLYYYNAPLHWMKAFDFLPRSFNERDGLIYGSHYKSFSTAKTEDAHTVISLLNSNLYYLWFIMVSNCRDLSVREVYEFPFEPSKLSKEVLNVLGKSLMQSYKDNSTIKVRMQKTTGRMELQEIDPRKSKPIIDEIDRTLAQHYGFTDEELDFILNYDIKYRMGRGGADGGDGAE